MAVAATISITVVAGLFLLCWIGTKIWGWTWRQIVAGACLGVAGANGFVGDICRMITKIGIDVFRSLMHSLG